MLNFKKERFKDRTVDASSMFGIAHGDKACLALFSERNPKLIRIDVVDLPQRRRSRRTVLYLTDSCVMNASSVSKYLWCSDTPIYSELKYFKYLPLPSLVLFSKPTRGLL